MKKIIPTALFLLLFPFATATAQTPPTKTTYTQVMQAVHNLDVSCQQATTNPTFVNVWSAELQTHKTWTTLVRYHRRVQRDLQCRNLSAFKDQRACADLDTEFAQAQHSLQALQKVLQNVILEMGAATSS